MSLSVDERFWAKVEFGEDCWLWTGSTKAAGYGQFRFEGRPQYAHRVAYQLVVGPIPAGLQLDHLCGVRNCVNPDHLEAVTQQENIARGPVGSQTHCPQGHPYDEANTYHLAGRRYCCACGQRRPNAQVL